MEEHREIASALEPVIDGIWHWRVTDADGTHESSSHAVRIGLDDGRIGCVLVDPVRLDGHAMQQLPHVIVAIVLTSARHQRDAWRIRRLHGAEVWAPVEATGFDEEPDLRYRAGEELPGGLMAIATPASGACSLFLPDQAAVLVPDLLVRDMHEGGLAIPAGLRDDRHAARSSIAALARLRPDIVLLDHGAPVTEGATAQIERALLQA